MHSSPTCPACLVGHIVYAGQRRYACTKCGQQYDYAEYTKLQKRDYDRWLASGGSEPEYETEEE